MASWLVPWEILERLCSERGISDWRRRLILTHGSYRSSLRKLLGDLGIVFWAELDCGISWLGYRCLDLYVKIMCKDEDAIFERAHFLLNSEKPPCDRTYDPLPENWYRFTFWESVGQRHVEFEGIAEDVRVSTVARLRADAERQHHMTDPEARFRYAVLWRHLNIGFGMPVEVSSVGKGKGKGKSDGSDRYLALPYFMHRL